MKYIVSHHRNYEPSGHKSFPDKVFKSREEAQAYYDKQRQRCLKKAQKDMKEHPKLYSEKVMRKDLFQDLPQDCLEQHLYWGDLAGFCYHDNWHYDSWDLSYEEDFED